MTPALRYEWRRLWTIRSTWWLVGGTLLLQLVFAFLAAVGSAPTYSRFEAEETASAIVSLGASFGFSPLFSAYIIALLGVLSFGHEYRHGMIRATLTAVPDRAAVFAAKALTTALLAGVLAFACALVGIAMTGLFADTGAATSQAVWGVTLGLVLYTVLFALCGLATTAILRHQTGALGLTLLVPSVMEQVIRLILLLISRSGNDANELAKYLPFDAGSQMYARPTADIINNVLDFHPFGAVAGGLVLVFFTAALLGLGFVLFLRRDA